MNLLGGLSPSLMPLQSLSMQTISPPYLWHSSNARVYIDFEGQNIVTILVRLSTHWYTFEPLL